MCGRFYILMEEDGDAERIVFPGDEVDVLTADGWRTLTWGFPSYDGKLLINARAETAAIKPTFKGAMKSRRCLIPAKGFFEWQREDGRKTKKRYRIFGKNGDVLMMAGLYNEAGKFVILTEPPNDVVAPIHDRMPVVMPNHEMQELWLHEDSLAEVLLDMRPDVPMKASAGGD